MHELNSYAFGQTVVLVASNLGAVSWHHMLFSLVLDYQPHAHAKTPAGKRFGSGLQEVRVVGVTALP